MKNFRKIVARAGLSAFALSLAGTGHAAVLYAFDGTIVRPNSTGLIIYNIKWTYITPSFLVLTPASGTDELTLSPAQLNSCTVTKFIGSTVIGGVGCANQNLVRSGTDSFVNFRVADVAEPSGFTTGFLSAPVGAFFNFGVYNDSFPVGAGSNFGTLTVSLAPVPEPASWAMMIAGFGIVGATLRRRAAKLRHA
jgi:PEP-CTERM motif